MGLFSRFCVWALRCTAEEYLHCVRNTSYRLIDSTPTDPALARAEPDARAQKLLRVDGLADNRLAVGHQRERRVETLHLRAGDVDPMELALERAGIGRKLHWHERAANGRARRRRF